MANSIAEEVFTLIKVVMAYFGKDKEIERYTKQLNLAKEINVKKSLCIGINTGCLSLLCCLYFSTQYWYAKSLLLNNDMYDVQSFLIVN